MPDVAAPQLYLEILSLIDELERAGRHAVARRAGEHARVVYASGWDAEHVRRLDHLPASLRRSLARR